MIFSKKKNNDDELPMNSKVSSKYFRRSAHPLSRTDRRLYAISVARPLLYVVGTCSSVVTFSTCVMPMAAKRVGLLASLPLPRYRNGSTLDNGCDSIDSRLGSENRDLIFKNVRYGSRYHR